MLKLKLKGIGNNSRVLQVNGTDVSSFPYEDAVHAFLTAREPIVVEVKRRKSNSTTCDIPVSSNLMSTAVQTDLSGLGWMEERSFECLTHDIDFEVCMWTFQLPAMPYNSCRSRG